MYYKKSFFHLKFEKQSVENSLERIERFLKPAWMWFCVIVVNAFETEWKKVHKQTWMNTSKIPFWKSWKFSDGAFIMQKKEDAKDKLKSLLDEACQKPIHEPFIEEWVIAGCDMTMVNVNYCQ